MNNHWKNKSSIAITFSSEEMLDCTSCTILLSIDYHANWMHLVDWSFMSCLGLISGWQCGVAKYMVISFLDHTQRNFCLGFLSCLDFQVRDWCFCFQLWFFFYLGLFHFVSLQIFRVFVSVFVEIPQTLSCLFFRIFFSGYEFLLLLHFHFS